jgi:chemotaxis protein histidine kinase CheA
MQKSLDSRVERRDERSEAAQKPGARVDGRRDEALDDYKEASSDSAKAEQVVERAMSAADTAAANDAGTLEKKLDAEVVELRAEVVELNQQAIDEVEFARQKRLRAADDSDLEDDAVTLEMIERQEAQQRAAIAAAERDRAAAAQAAATELSPEAKAQAQQARKLKQALEKELARALDDEERIDVPVEAPGHEQASKDTGKLIETEFAGEVSESVERSLEDNRSIIWAPTWESSQTMSVFKGLAGTGSCFGFVDPGGPLAEAAKIWIATAGGKCVLSATAGLQALNGDRRRARFSRRYFDVQSAMKNPHVSRHAGPQLRKIESSLRRELAKICASCGRRRFVLFLSRETYRRLYNDAIQKATSQGLDLEIDVRKVVWNMKAKGDGVSLRVTVEPRG